MPKAGGTGTIVVSLPERYVRAVRHGGHLETRHRVQVDLKPHLERD